MAVQKLTPRHLNKDDDERLVKATEMTDALNVRVSSDDNGDALVLKNAYGNTEITLQTALPAGTNKVIGSVASEQSNSIYYFVWNSNNDHSIYKYSVGTNKAQQVYKDSVLSFNKNGFVKANVVTSVDGDELVYFNSGTSEPKKINASKALRDNSYPGGSTDEEKLLFLTVAKQPPLSPPTFNIVNNASLKENNIGDKVFQFAYRYIYEDGEISALSPYSSLTASIAQLRDGFNTEEAIDFYNQINVFVKNTIADVSKIQVFAREGNEGTFYEIAEKTNNKNTNAVTINFNNQFKGEALSIDDKNKLFDNVPQQADSQEIVDGRLMYGGYTEGYPNTNLNVSLIANYKDTEPIYNISLSVTSSLSGTFVDFDLSTLPDPVPEDSMVYINVNVFSDTMTFKGASSAKLDFDYDVSVVTTDLEGNNILETTLSKTTDEVNFIGSGLLLSEKISVGALTSRNDVFEAIKQRLTSREYNIMLRSTRGGLVEFEDGTAAAQFKSSLNARAITKIVYAPSFLKPTRFEVQVERLDMYLGETDFNLTTIGRIGQAALKFFGGKEVLDDNGARILKSSPIIQVSNLRYQFDSNTVDILGVAFTSATIDSSQKSFKSGSSHALGIVYYDDRNRSGGVQELGDVYIEPLNDRSSENNLYGAASVVMRLPDSAPSWARRWSPVYKGKGRSELKLMYSINGAFVPFRTNSSKIELSQENRIYLSLNSLFEDKYGYNDAQGANIKYAFSPGDKLRVVEYDDGQRITNTFRVLGYEELDGSESNPILDASSERSARRTTGSFLIIEEDINATGFTAKSLINRSSNWYKNCVIEIYNSRKDDSEIYYELGKGYDVINSVHSDERTATAFTATASSGLLTSATKIFKGDILETTGQPALTILNSWDRNGTYYAYYRTTPTFVDGSYSFTVSNPEKVIDLSLGDVYFRKRSLYTSVANEKNIVGEMSNVPTTAIVKYIEDYSVSDFFDSKSSSIGRPIAPIADAKTVKRSGSITYSEVYLEDGTFNGLSSFNLSLANFKDLSYEHGSIKGLVGYNQRLYFIQENRSGVLAVNRSVIETGSGDNLVALSKNVLQSEQYYVGEYGTAHPESVSSRDGMVYFADVKRGRVLRIDLQGLTIISDANMSSYFDDKFGVISKYSPTTVVGGIDRDNDEYILSSPDITQGQVTINTNEYVYNAQVSSGQVIADYEYNPNAVFSFDTEDRTFSDICDEFQDSVGAVVYLDELADGGVIYVDSPYEVSNLYGVATNRDRDFYVSINVNMFLPGFTFDNSYCTSDDVGGITSDAVVSNEFTIAYGTSDKAWTTRYSFIPESIVSLNNDLYTFKSGKIYKHSESANRNTYYGGSLAASIVEAVANGSPSAIKSFESLSIEGDTAWDATVTTTNQTAVIDDTSFQEKEGFYYAYIHGDTSSYGSTISSVSSTSEIFVLGDVDTGGEPEFTGVVVNFKSKINTTPFPLGSTATVYRVNGSQLDSISAYPASITGEKSIKMNAEVTLVEGDFLVVVGNSAIEGDQIRDYFAKIKLTKSSADPIELYAVNTVFADSKLHN